MSELLLASENEVHYLHDHASLAAMSPSEQFKATTTPGFWILDKFRQDFLDEESDLVGMLGMDYFSRETAEAFVQDPNASLLARLNIVNGMSMLLNRELDPEYQHLMFQISLFDDPHVAESKMVLGGPTFSEADSLTVRRAAVDNYRQIILALADYEGIDRELLLTAGTEGEDEAPEPWDHMPTVAVELLRYVGSFSAKDGGYLSDELKMLLPVAKDLKNRLLELAEQDGSYESYMRFVHGPDLMGEYAELASLSPEGALKFQQQTPQIFEAAEQVKAFFPPEQHEAVREAFLQKMFASVYGYTKHERQGRQLCDPVVLGQDFELPAEFHDSEPYDLVDRFLVAIRREHALSQDPLTKITPSVQHPTKAGFQNYRLSNGDWMSRQHIRPWADLRFDPRFDFGRVGEGVEGTGGRIIKTRPGYLPMGKDAAYLSDTISIRVDREGLDPREPRNALGTDRDPTRKIGSLALDIGSVLGPDHNFGVRLGRFLAVCDALRVKKTSPEPSTLNHAHSFFAPSDDAEFAASLARYARSYDGQTNRV